MIAVGTRVIILVGCWRGLAGTVAEHYPNSETLAVRLDRDLTIEKRWHEVRPLNLIEMIGDLA